MDWGTLIAAFTGAFIGNILGLGLILYYILPKIREAMNPLGNMFGSEK